MKKKKHLPIGDILFNGINNFLMLLLIIIMLYPFWYCVILSFNDSVDFLKGPLYLWPRKFTLENYEFVLGSPSIGIAIRNSILRTVIGTILHCVFTGAAAYGLSKPDLLYRKFYTTVFVITMYFGGGMIPTYLLLRDIGFIDSFLVYVIPTMWSFYNAILFMSYYESIPGSLEESARIDGANTLVIYFRIIFPASLPIFATVALYSIVGQWNSWFDTVIYTKSEQLVTLQSMMAKILQMAENQKKMMEQLAKSSMVNATVPVNISPTTVRVATMVITTFPIVVVYPFFQKYFVKGIMLGAVKG
ncbi:MAG: carbohydrate ABC transporter permease [Ruminococcaceae bacterium]|nr:carbohydrate ABC transporter permease [Oscillospiraceae bacterium]